MGCVAGIILLLLVWFMGLWTNHGKEEVVPDVKGLFIDNAVEVLEKSSLTFSIADSIFDTTRVAGTVIEQNPHPMSRVKPGRTVYLTIVAFNPKMVTVPDIVNSSSRQAQSILNGMGIRNITIKYEPSEYPDLVLGVLSDNKNLKPGTRIPINAKVVLIVGQGGTTEEGEYGGHISVEDVEDEVWRDEAEHTVIKTPDKEIQPAVEPGPTITPEPEPEVPFLDE